MVIRRRQSAEYWKEVIEDFLKSGMIQKDYAREKKICRATLLAWSKRLGISLSQRGKMPKIDKEPALTFTNVQVLGKIKVASPSLKIEIFFPQGHTLKLETEGGWEQVGVFIKAVVG